MGDEAVKRDGAGNAGFNVEQGTGWNGLEAGNEDWDGK